ncbi:protein Niban 1-like [Polymixia lowei]
MGASSSGLLDEAKVSHVKGLADSMLQRFSVFYRQQYSTAHTTHLHQEVEPKKEGRGLLLKHRPPYAPEEVLFEGNAQVFCWEEQGRKWDEVKKGRGRYTVLRRDYRLEIYDSMEAWSRGGAAILVLHPAGGAPLTTQEESRTLLDQSCSGILNGVKEDSSSVVSAPGVFPVYLHLPYTGHTYFLFAQEEQRNRFLSALKTCIRHRNLDPWRDPSYESQAFLRAFRLYRQDRGCYESWEMLLGTEEQVLANQVMEEVLPWLQSELQARVKGKRSERIRQWMAMVQATYNLIVEQLINGLEVLKGECRQTALANQALIRPNLDQIMASRCFLEDKLRACIHGPAEKLCGETIAPYLPSILAELTEHMSGGIQGIHQTLKTKMDAALTHTQGGTEGLEKGLSTLRSTNLDHCYTLVENLREKLQDLKQRYRFTNTQQLVHSAHIEMEQLLDSAVYTLELFLQSSARHQPSEITVAMERAKERVLKQLHHDCRVVQRRLYQEALLEITLPALTRDMDNMWQQELQQFEQYIFSDYSSFILVHNVYDDVLRDILSKEIERVVQEAANQKTNRLPLDSFDLAISQYSLIGMTPPHSAPSSPAVHVRDSSPLGASQDRKSTSLVGDGGQQSNPKPQNDPKPDPDPSPVLSSPAIVVTQPSDSMATSSSLSVEPHEAPRRGTDTSPETNTTVAPNSVTPASDTAIIHGCDTHEVPAVPVLVSPDPCSTPDCSGLSSESPNSSVTPLPTPASTAPPSEPETGDLSATKADPSVSYMTQAALSPVDDSTPSSSATSPASGHFEKPSSSPSSSSSSPCPQPDPSLSQVDIKGPPPCTDGPMRVSLALLSAAVGCDSITPSVGQIMVQRATDRAVYLTGRKEGREVEREKVDREGGNKREEVEEVKMEVARTEKGKESTEEKREDGEKEEKRDGGEIKSIALVHTEGNAVENTCISPKPPAECTITSMTIDQGEEEEEVRDHIETGAELEKVEIKRGGEEEEEKGEHKKEGGKAEEEEEVQLMTSQPESVAVPLDSVAAIRGLVSEVIEVETLVNPNPHGNNTA